MAVDMETSMHGSLRDEVQMLRRRVIKLQNIDTEAEQLRKELTKAQEEKATSELEFMNQLNSFARENASATEEMEGCLAENDKVIRDLVEQLENTDTPEVIAEKIREIEARHKKELALLVDDNQNEIKKCQKEMAEVQLRKIDELMAEVAERNVDFGANQKEISSLEAKVSALQSEQSSVSQSNELEGLQHELDSAQAEATQLNNQFNESQAEIARLKDQLHSLHSTLLTNTHKYEEEMKTLRDKLESYETELANKTSKITQLESSHEELSLANHARGQLEKEIQMLKTAQRELEDENQRLRSLQRASPASKDRMEQENRELQFAQLESERKIRDVTTSRDSLEVENKELNLSRENLQRENGVINALREKLEKDNQERKQSRQSFEKDNQELKKSRQSLNDENQDLKKSLQSLESENQQLKRSVDPPTRSGAHETAAAIESAIPKRSNSTIAERRSVFEKHVQKLEHNAKRGWQQKLVVNTNFRRQVEEETGSSAAQDSPDQLAVAALKTENGNLNTEVDDLKQKLEVEKENATSLRREVSDLKASPTERQSNAPTTSPSKNPSIDGPTSRHFSASKSPSSAGGVSPSVVELTQRLKREKEMAMKLHQERSDLRASISSKRPEASPSSNIIRAPVGEQPTPTRGPTLPPKSPAMSIRTQPNPMESARLSTDAASPRTPVRGLVQSLERRISQISHGDDLEPPTIVLSPSKLGRVVQGLERRISQASQGQIDEKPATGDDSEPPTIVRSQFSFPEISAFTDNVDELQRALIFERQEVQELEAELTRQCEINCSLLQEIKTLTAEAEASIAKEALQYEQKSIAHQAEIDGLSSDILKLRSQVKQGTQFEQKSNAYQKEIDSLSSEVLRLRSQVKEGSGFEHQSTGYQKEINSLSSEISRLKSQLTESESSRLNQSKQFAEDDIDEIDRLKTHISQLQTDVGPLQEAILRFQEKNMSDQEGIEKLQSQVDKFESQLANEKRLKLELSDGYEIAVEANKAEIQQLEAQVAGMKLEFAKADGSPEEGVFGQAEIQRLQHVGVELKSNLSEAKAKVSEKEQEIERLEILIQDLRTQANLVEERSKKLAAEHDSTKAEVKGMRSQNANLIVELDKITETRDELESRDQGHQREFDNLRTKVDEKVAEVENVHRADKEQISRLRSQVEALQQELEETLSQVEKLQMDLKEKEGVEATVEAMSRSNTNLLDSQINKLQKELTKTQLTKSGVETDYAKKIEELEDMIDSMQTEMDESVEEKEKEIEELKRGVDLKDDMISELVKEKDQLVLSMTDMMTSRRDEIDELQAELMEMSTRAADQVREVQNLKLQLSDTGFRREEMDKMRCQVHELREQVSERDDSRMDEKAELEMENSELRQRMRQVSLERHAGEEKLREFIANQGSSKTVQVLRERNATLKLEVEKMSKKLKKMAAHMERQQKQSTASQSVGSMRVAI